MPTTASIQAQVTTQAIALGIDPRLALAQAHAESAYDPSAVSSQGAMGVMQLMPATAASLGVANPFDPTQNIKGGLTYMQQLLTEFGGDEAAALAAYDWGPGNVTKAIAAHGSNWLAYAPTETQNYVDSILGAVSTADPVTVSTDTTDSGTADPTASDAPALPVYGWLALAALGLVFAFDVL